MQWVYDVTVREEGAVLEVRATFAPGVLDVQTDLSVTEGAEPFVRQVASSSGAVAPRGTSWSIPSCAAGCTVQYRFALREACESLQRDEVANGDARALQAPAGAWILRPMAARERDSFELTVRTPEARGSFASGLRGTTRDSVTTIRGIASEIGRSPYTLFGPLKLRPMRVEGASLTLALSDAPRAVSDADVVGWAERSGAAVVGAFGRFPIDGVMVAVLPGRRARNGGVGFGRATAGGLGAAILVDLSATADAATLRRDWVLVHEMIHLAFPSLDVTHRWMEEGLATYLEPLLRARAGLISPTEVWTDFSAMLHNGLPQEGDRGLDVTRTWGRLYWGGALFCFVADLEIRKRTNGRRSLDDALRAILDAGGNNGARWTIERTFAVGDAATGVDVLTSMYAAWKRAPVAVDLPKTFRELGVKPTSSGAPVTLDDGAPLASLRRAMTTPR